MSSPEEESGPSGSDTDYSEIWTDSSDFDTEDEEIFQENGRNPPTDPDRYGNKHARTDVLAFCGMEMFQTNF